ncbi:MAG: ExbD/TolR family protein [Opitutales bacterium]
MSEINISPLIDMVFILLIFFIVAAVFVEEPGVEVNRVFTVSGDSLEKNAILFAITNDNEVVYGGENVGVLSVRPIVDRLKATKDMPVILQVDEGSDASVVVRVIDEAKIAGAATFIATEKP